MADRRAAVFAAAGEFAFELADPGHLGAVLQGVRNVEGVFDVERVTA